MYVKHIKFYCEIRTFLFPLRLKILELKNR